MHIKYRFKDKLFSSFLKNNLIKYSKKSYLSFNSKKTALEKDKEILSLVEKKALKSPKSTTKK